MAFRQPTRIPAPRPIPRSKSPSGKLNLLVVNPAFQNWCQNGNDRSEGGVFKPQVGIGQNVTQNFGHERRSTFVHPLALRDNTASSRQINAFGRPQKDTWDSRNEEQSVHGSHVNLTVSETNRKSKGRSRITHLLMALICFVSLTSLALTVMMLLGKLGDRCGCRKGKFHGFCCSFHCFTPTCSILKTAEL